MKRHVYHNLIGGILLSSLLLLLACQQGVQPPSISVKGEVHGKGPAGNSVAPDTLSLTHDPALAPLPPRVAYHAATGIAGVDSLVLQATASTGLPFQEDFFLLNLSHEIEPGIGTVTDAPGWVRNHVGNLAIIPIRKDDITLPRNRFSAFNSTTPQWAGATWLARVENNDREIPWIISENAPNSFPLPLSQTLVAPPSGESSDRFDLQTLVTMFLANIAGDVTAAVMDMDLPVVSANANNHRVYVVPHVPFEATAAPGFGLIYSVDVNVRLGVQIGRMTVYVPISFHFSRTGGTNYEISVDPLSSISAGWVNSDRVLVEYGGLIPPNVAEDVRDGVLETFADFELPELPVATITSPDSTVTPVMTPFEDALALILSLVAPNSSTVPADYNIIALPEVRATLSGPISNLAVQMPFVTITTIAAGGSTIAGTTVDASGRVTITAPIDSATFRITRLEPVVTVNRFKLVFLE